MIAGLDVGLFGSLTCGPRPARTGEPKWGIAPEGGRGTGVHRRTLQRRLDDDALRLGSVMMSPALRGGSGRAVAGAVAVVLVGGLSPGPARAAATRELASG